MMQIYNEHDLKTNQPWPEIARSTAGSPGNALTVSFILRKANDIQSRSRAFDALISARDYE